ncbi:MAG: phosphoribosyltransferase [Flavobacteriales bacterium]|nr:phosphoribosyltransferase [Flavobacteriales bacterium]
MAAEERTLILNHLQIEQRIIRMAWEIYENHYDDEEIVIAGIAERGFKVAKRVSVLLAKITDIKITLAELKLSKENPMGEDIRLSILPADYTDKTVILVDDVLNSGRTLMYGAKYFLTTPFKSLDILVLVDRGHNRFPIQATYAGMKLSTTLQEHVSVEFGKEDAVYLE